MDNLTNISFIIPVYNGEKTISRCLDSILHQSFTDFEIIIIDDGSTDNTSMVCEKYLGPNVSFFSQENKGVSSARNLGISKAKGKWVSFVDADDIIFSNSLKEIAKDSKLVELIKNNEEGVDFVLFNSFEFEGSEKTLVYPLQRKLSGKLIDTKLLLEKYNYERNGVWGCLYNLDFLNKYNIRFQVGLNNSEDALFFALVQWFSSKMYYKNIDFYCYIIREYSASSLWNDVKVIDLADSLIVIEKILEDKGIVYHNSPLFNLLVYSNISYTYHKLFSNKLSKDTLIYLRKKVETSPLYPINTDGIPFTYKLKICLLNFSLSLFEKITALQCFFSKK